MWRVTPVFLFMCGILTMHLASQDWSAILEPWPSEAAAPAAVITAARMPASEPPATSPIAERVAALSLEAKVGQLLMIGHWQSNSPLDTKALIEDYYLGGVIVMDAASSSIKELPSWTNTWQAASAIPLLISIDQEGGVVSRLRSDNFDQTSQREINTPVEAEAIGYTRGQELRALGINTNLAPVIDYASSPDAFLYERSFASSSQIGTLASALIAGHQAAGVLSIPKHYPGHAATPEDSHYVLPVVDITAAEFPEHVTAFHHLLDLRDVPALMTAHVQFPKLDAEFPATLSYEILSRQLRRELNFSGVIITDDMTMGAITNQWPSSDAAVQALQAGADMILFAAEPEAALAAHDQILAAIASGDLSEARIDESVTRILALKESQGMLQ